jgi:hypothetical protein
MNHTIPNSLIAYQEALEDAIRREIAAAPSRRRRVWIRFVMASATTAAVVLGALSLLVSGAPSRVAPAAADVIHRAAAALAEAPGTILHIKDTVTQDNGDGTTVSWTQESFDQQQAPYDSRMVNVQLPGTPAGTEQATVRGVSQVYDPTRNTIYVGPAPAKANPDASSAAAQLKAAGHHYRFSPGPTPGTYRVHMQGLIVRGARVSAAPAARVRMVWRTMIVTAAQAKALRAGTDAIRFDRKGPKVVSARAVGISPASPQTTLGDLDPNSPAFRGQVLGLLRSGQAQVVGHATVADRDTLEIRSADGHITYYVAPDTYQPVELTTRGTSGGTVMRFDTYEQLPLNENSALLSLTAQHPTATIDRDPGDYNAAQARLFPHG